MGSRQGIAVYICLDIALTFARRFILTMVLMISQNFTISPLSLQKISVVFMKNNLEV